MLRQQLPTKTEQISITLPGYQVQILDYYQNVLKRKRSEMIAEAVRIFLLMQSDSHELWEEIYHRRFGL